MKKSILLLACMLIVNCLYSQDIAPSSQAQGYLESKNVTVDYATGIFHYKVPLYNLESGGFSLLISADYAAKGVKVEDLPGLLGYNWTLNTGGIVTRTVRGGIADEEYSGGYLWGDYLANPVPLKDDLKKINLHQRDGESDIFTAVFNGRSVNFIIRMNADLKIYAEPLEKTDVKIECEMSVGKEINGWIITDETGSRYIYRQKEWSTDVYKEEAVSFNGIRNKSYISSWYLSLIEPKNSSPIIYNYREVVSENGKQIGILQSRFNYNYSSKYTYGRPLVERTFDFKKYEKDFKFQIDEAKSYLTTYSWELQINNALHVYTHQGQWVLNPNFEAGIDAINNNFRIMGQLAGFRNIGGASYELIQILDNLYDMYINNSSSNARMAAYCFKNAKSYVTKSLLDMNFNVTERKVFNNTTLIIRSPMLDRICYTDRIIKFGYDESDLSGLTNLKFCDLAGERISEIRFSSVGSSELRKIIFMDKDSVETHHINFDYFMNGSGSYNIGYDVWGYPKSIADWNNSGVSYVDTVFSKNSSLKTITLADGGNIHLDYESNRVVDPNIMDSLNSRRVFTYGGIRLKSFIFNDPSSECSDTIYYYYPLPGFLVYQKASPHEKVQYAGFSDKVLNSRIKYDGLAFLNTGNNGIYYRYVQEVFSGRGIQAYLFHVPLINSSNRYELYPFWLVALPLGVASYDRKGSLKQLVKNKYITSWEFYNQPVDKASFANRDYFVADRRFLYDRNLSQVKAYEYYMDADQMSQYYLNQENVISGLNPYREIYIPNIMPRTTVVIPDRSYFLCYGGKTLLQKQSIYHFDYITTTQPDISDFSGENSGFLYKQMEYFYDQPAGTLNPTRFVTTDSRGDVYTTLTKWVGNMTDATDVTIARMKAANMKALPVKEIHMKNNLLQKEKVFLYTVSDTNGRCFAGVKEQWTYVPEKDLSVTAVFPDPALFTYDRDKYIWENKYKYCQMSDFFLPVEMEKRSGKETVYYDFSTGRAILRVPYGNTDMAMAVDCWKNMNFLSDSMPEVNHNKTIFESCRIMSIDCRIMASVTEDPVFLAYTKTEEHQKMLELIDVILKADTVRLNKLITEEIIALPFIRSKFLEQYLGRCRQYDLYINVERFRQALITMIPVLSSPKNLGSDFWIFCNDYKENIPSNDVWIIKSIANCTKWKMYILASKHEIISYTVLHKGGIVKENIETQNSSFYSLQEFDIDLSSYEDIVSITVGALGGTNNIAYLALLPADAEFEATSYNMDGTVFARFDQTGRLELNEYDSGGRLIRVRDGKGNILQEYQYNVATN